MINIFFSKNFRERKSNWNWQAIDAIGSIISGFGSLIAIFLLINENDKYDDAFKSINTIAIEAQEQNDSITTQLLLIKDILIAINKQNGIQNKSTFINRPSINLYTRVDDSTNIVIDIDTKNEKIAKNINIILEGKDCCITEDFNKFANQYEPAQFTIKFKNKLNFNKLIINYSDIIENKYQIAYKYKNGEFIFDYDIVLKN